jgi:hypothetical protein
MGGPRSKLDATQVLPHAFDDGENALRFIDGSALVPVGYNRIELQMTGSNVTTVIYKKDGVVVATLSLEYDGSDNLTSIERS